MREYEHYVFSQLYIKSCFGVCKKCEHEWDKVLYDVENKFGFTK